jgi:hypothetical protein
VFARNARSRRLQQQLRHLPPVDRQRGNFTLADVGPDARRTQIDRGRVPFHRHRLADAGGMQLEVQAELLPRSQRHVGEFERLEAAERGRDRVDRWLQIGDYVAPVRRRGDRAHVASFLILGRHGCPRHERAGLIEDRAREAGVALGIRDSRHDQQHRHCGHENNL